MNKREILERAIELKECSEEFESVEFLESDVEFFADVVEIIQRTAQEVPVQEQLKEIYPTTIEFYASLQSIIDNRMVTSDEAIKLNLQINSNMYDVNDVYRGIILIYQRLLECFR